MCVVWPFLRLNLGLSTNCNFCHSRIVTPVQDSERVHRVYEGVEDQLLQKLVSARKVKIKLVEVSQESCFVKSRLVDDS